MNTYIGLLVILSWGQVNEPTPRDKHTYMGVVFESKYLRIISKSLTARKVVAGTSFEQAVVSTRYLAFTTNYYLKVKSVMSELKRRKKVGNYYFMTGKEIEKKFFPPLNALDSFRIRREAEMFQMRLQKQRDDIFFKF